MARRGSELSSAGRVGVAVLVGLGMSAAFVLAMWPESAARTFIVGLRGAAPRVRTWRGEQSMTGLGVSQRVRRREKWAS
jgi:hypothetical protein